MVYTETTVERSVNDVWEDWTTTDGLAAHFSPTEQAGDQADNQADNIEIELRPGGVFNIGPLPNPNADGTQESAGTHILGLQTPDQKNKTSSHMIQFTWPAPAHISGINDQMTSVQIWFVPVGNHTRIRLFQTGFGDTPKWLKARDYFEKSWPQALERYDQFVMDAD